MNALLLCRYSVSSASLRTISPGRDTAQRKRAATGLKSRSLKVTMASARPLMAVSNTISSFGSGNIGRSRIASFMSFNSTPFGVQLGHANHEIHSSRGLGLDELADSYSATAH
jgi:hypothetical protein